MARWAGFVLAAVWVLGCGPEEAGPAELLGEASDSIVNGQLDSGDPAVVYIDVGCSGTLVSPRVVLTACHCMESASIGYPEVFFGSNKNQSGTWINTVHHQVQNPSQCIGNGDVAMITLAEPGPATPIPLNERDLGSYVGDPVRLVGFGVTGQNQGGSGVKREGPTKLHQLEGQGLMWVGGETSNFCYGDSGGPNFMMFEGVEHVAGVTSFVQNGCGNFSGDGAARVDAYLGWMKNYIDDHDPATCAADGRCAEDCGAIDPDCPCAADGFCDAACSELDTDPDCDGCGVDGVCRQDCPLLDSDCCVADDHCVAECGSLDPDCQDIADPNDPADPDNPADPSDPGQPFVPGSDSASAADDGLVGSVVCSMPAALSRTPQHFAWLLALAGAALCRRVSRW